MPVGAAKTRTGAVEHLKRLAVASLDLEHAPQRERDRDLSSHVGRDGECCMQISRGLRVPRVGLGEAKLEQDVGAQRFGGWLRERAPQVRGGRVRSAVRDRGPGGRTQ